MSSSTTDTYELLSSVRDILSTLQLDSEGEVMEVDNMFMNTIAEGAGKEQSTYVVLVPMNGSLNAYGFS